MIRSRFNICIKLSTVICLLCMNFSLGTNSAPEISRNITDGVILVSVNPYPDTLPTLSVRKETKDKTDYYYVVCNFLNIPGFRCECWCYESKVKFISARVLKEGSIELTHESLDKPGVLIITTVTPEPGAVEFDARMQSSEPDTIALPEDNIPLNLCWQLKKAPGFCSRPAPYPEFVKRCFIFVDTDKGKLQRIFLDNTVRRKIPCRSDDDIVNNSPWVQMYNGTWQEKEALKPETSWANYSTTQYALTVIGAVSKDNKYLTALATNNAYNMCQAWHDCMHNNPYWEPVDKPPEHRRWRLKIYAMDNNPEALIAKVQKDFPQILQNRNAGKTIGVNNYLPVFYEKIEKRLKYPSSWTAGKYDDFTEWKHQARKRVMSSLMAAPPKVEFNPHIVDRQDRGTYSAQKIMFNLTGYSRVLGYLLKPKDEGPFPAVLLLHDHGARFDIGKEKVIRPFGDGEKTESSRQWINKYYGGRYIGDELAKRGYVCFATDALNWSDRGGAGYDGQQALASNLLNYGMTFAGLIAYEDLYAADFLAGLPFVDTKKIAAMGLSMGGFRTWQLAALSDHICAGVSVCWMSTLKDVMYPGANATIGASNFTMVHPGLFQDMEYPDIASLACPKPMLFYNGLQDGLFPVKGVREAYEKMRTVWASQKIQQKLVTKIWDAKHEFTLEMQKESFVWLEKTLSGK